MKKFRWLLLMNVAIGILLTFITVGLLQVLGIFGSNENFLLMSYAVPAYSVAYLYILILVIGADIFWASIFALWLLKKRLHIKDVDNTLYLP